MAVSTLFIKRRIRSIGNTRKITRAMELVSAAKMRKAVHMTVASRGYSHLLKDVVEEISARIDPFLHPLLFGRKDSKNLLAIVVASDRGLCGGFNAQLLRKALEFLRRRTESEINVVTLGKRADRAIKRAGYKIAASFEPIAKAPSFEKTRPISKYVHNEFIAGKVDRVFIVYTDFKSAISQIPTVEQLLPIIPEDKLPAGAGSNEDAMRESESSNILFEPNAQEILEQLLPRLVGIKIYQALLESAASEHSARMLAMQNATSNATQMIDDLTFTFNQARQASITREISEISAGKAAIE